MTVKLVGPEPPKNFKTDGLSGVPDLWMTPAGVRHDFRYAIIRDMKIQLRKLKREKKKYKRGSFDHMAIVDSIHALKDDITIAKHDADREFKENIRRLSRGSFVRKAVGKVVGFVYYRGVRRLGWIGLKKLDKIR